MRLKKPFTILLSAAGLSLALAGCTGDDEGTSEASGSSGSGDTEIQFTHLWPEGSSKKHYDVVNEIIADFESENEGVTIDLEVLSNEQYKDKLRVLSTSGQLPDVGMTWAAGFLEPYVGGNMFAPLDELIEGELSDTFVPGTVEAYEMDGATYGLPLELNIATLYYNEAMFEEQGLEAPETYEELVEVVEAFRAEGVQPIALGNRDAWTGSFWYMYMADRVAGTNALNDAINRDASFEDEGLVEAAARVQELVDMDAFVNGFNGLADEEAKSMFMNEQAPMYLIATWDLPNFTTNEDVPQELRDSINYLKFPTVDGQGDMNSFVGGPGVGLFVAEESDVKEEAKAFASYFVQQWGEKAVQEAGVIPASKVDVETLDLPDMYIDILNELNDATNITLFADVQMSPATAQVHLDSIQALFGNQMTPEEFGKAHEDALSQE